MTAALVVFGGLAIVAALIVMSVARAAAARMWGDAHAADPRRGATTFRMVGPAQARGQAALVTSGEAREGDRVTVDGDGWTVSEVEDVAGDVRAWLVPGPTPDMRKLMDAEVDALAAALQPQLEAVAVAAIGTLAGVPHTPDVDDIATLRVESAMRREANLVRPWLVDVGVSCADDLPADAMPRCEHVGGGYVKCDCAALARRIAVRHVYG